MAAPTEIEEGDELYLQTLHAFLNVHRHLREYSRRIHASGRSGRQLSTLRFLLEHGEATMGTLSRFLYISESSTSELVAKLEEGGLVTRVRSAKDNRVVLVGLTPAGRSFAGETEIGGVPLLRERLKSLSSRQLKEIYASFCLLTKLLGLPEER